jgi:hypothetical protein
MPPAEIPWRAWRIARNRFGRCRQWTKTEDLPLVKVWNGECSADAFRSRDLGFPPIPAAEDIAKWPAAWREATVAEAENLLAHRFSFFALERKPLGATIDWNKDYSSGKSAPLGYAPALDYRDADMVGDVKYIWELGRMQHLARLAQAWLLTREDRFAAEIVGQITDWIRQCPHMMGIHWTSPMEAGLRIISWTWAFHLIRAWQGMTNEFCRLIARSVHQHLVFIDRNYSLFSSANNHLIAEASGAYFAAAYWSGLKHSPRWKSRARNHLVCECKRQNYADGVNKEQTFAYQFFIWDLFLIPVLMGRALGEDFPVSYWNRLERMAEFLAWVSDSSGNTPNVGDEDEGMAVDLGGNPQRPVIGLLNSAAIVWQRRDFKRWAGDGLDRKTAWQTDASKPYRHEGGSETRIEAETPRGSRSFVEGGYHVLRHGNSAEDEVLLLFDVGPLGCPRTAAHGHADALSLLLHLGGQPVLIDPGTYSYQNTPRRRYFRATAQHNTLCFPDGDQGQYLNRFLWGKRPKVSLLRADVKGTPQVIEGEVLWWDGPTHRRKIEFSPDSSTLKIEDAWNGPAPPVIRFCLSPDVTVAISGATCLVDGARMRLIVRNNSAPMELETAEISPRCYHLQPTRRLAIHPAEAVGHSITTISWEHR